jgi:ribose/xylose/arabinose/galactoside ABC-type transport system permease subunit/ABC-type sugar transport system substrate-binding protein
VGQRPALRRALGRPSARHVQAAWEAAAGRGPAVHMKPRTKWILPLALLSEIVVFSGLADNFFTLRNLFEIVRASVEVGLLALALTPVIVSGGIDLSVGSMMGLAAVVFGAAWQNWHASLVAAIGLALLVGCAGGALNALLIARFGIPALIVTLGSFSLLRGIAEGITHGAVNYSGFPRSWLFLGQGYLGGVVPAQIPIFLTVLAGYAVLLHRSSIGRAFYAIGFSAGNTRYAGIPVAKRIGLVYLLSGLAASVAAIVYVAHLGQAKSDAGTGYELDAITAVVLGGASVFGGRGTVGGTLLGVLSLAVLQNGLHLAALPSELTGVLTGMLLVASIGIDRFRARNSGAWIQSRDRVPSRPRAGVKFKLEVAVLSTAILAGALVIAGTNIRRHPGTANGARRRPVIAVMPKAKGDPYFVSCRKGAEEAARELGVDLIWDGPTGLDAAKQNEIVESWITRQVDVIAVSVENQAGISTVLRKARAHGIRVLTWDADAAPDARDFFVNQATAQAIGETLADEAARLLNGAGEFAIVTGALSAANQNEWIKFIRRRIAQKHPRLKLDTIQPSDDDRDKAFSETQTIVKVFPGVKLVMAISAPAVPGAAEAIRQMDLPTGSKAADVIGLSLPNISKPYIHSGIVQEIVLWNTTDLGYLTVYAGWLLAENKMVSGAKSIQAGRLGELEIRGSDIILGTPLIINNANADQFDS